MKEVPETWLPPRTAEVCDIVMGTAGVHADPDLYRLWLEARQQGIGGSDAAAAIGLSPWSSPRALYYDKTDPIVIREDIELFEAGRRTEDMNAQWFEDKTGLMVFKQPVMIRSRKAPFMFADPDFFCDIGGDEFGLVECKNVRAQNIHEWDDGPPLHYRLQLQHYLAVTDLALGFFATFVGGNQHLVFEVERDEKLIESLIAGEEAFWTCVQLRRPPDVDGSEATTTALKVHYADQEPGESVQVPESFRQLVNSHRSLKMQEKILQARIDEVENRMKDVIGNAEAAVIGDEVLATWKTQIRAAHEVKESKFRKLHVKDVAK